MSILSTAILTASLAGASCTSALPPGTALTSPDCGHRACASLHQSCLQDSHLQNPDQLRKFLEKCGMAQDSIQDILTVPGISGGIITPDCGTGSQKPEADNKPGDSSKPENSDRPGSDKPQQPGGGTENGGSGENQSLSAYAAEVVTLVNQERAKYNLAPLSVNAKASDAALTRAKEIVTSFSHTRPDGTSFSTALKEHGVSYRGSGENIAWGQKTPEEVVGGWMNSPGHRANILHEKFTDIGVGYHVQNGKAYWVQLFTY